MKLKNIAFVYPWGNATSPRTKSKVSAKLFKTSLVKFSVPNVLFSLMERIGGKNSSEDARHSGINESRRQRFSFSKFPTKKILWIAAVVIIVFALLKFVQNLSQSSALGNANLDVKPPIATLDLNKEYIFPLNGPDGIRVADIKYLVEKAELTDEIIVKGQKATAIRGRLFLIVTLKVSNDFTSPIEMVTKDYIRLSVNGNEEEWLAPDVHNDPVEVQAISTKYTRIGFAVADSDENLVIRVGQIEGEKEKIPLNF